MIELGIEKQQDIHAGAKALQEGIKEFLPYLQGLAINGAERETYKEKVENAIEATGRGQGRGQGREGIVVAAGAAQAIVKIAGVGAMGTAYPPLY